MNKLTSFKKNVRWQDKLFVYRGQFPKLLKLVSMQENHFPVSCEFPDTFKQNIYYPIKESGPISKCFKNVNLLTTSRVSYQSPSPEQ